MHHKIWLYISIVIVFCIGAILVYANYENRITQDQGKVLGTKTEKATVELSPSSGPIGTEFTINATGLHSNNSNVSITWGNDNLAVSSNSTDENGNFTAVASVPDDSQAKNYNLKVSTTGLAINDFGDKQFRLTELAIPKAYAKKAASIIQAQAIFTVTEIPQETPVTETATTTTATTSLSPTVSESPTATASTSTSISETTSVTNTTTTSALSTTSAASTATQSTTSAATPTETKISYLPMIIEDSNSQSSIELDKGQARADGEDKITLTIEIDNQTQEAPNVIVSGEENTVSEIKKEDNTYKITISSTKPEEKTVTVSSGNIKLPEVKIDFIDNNKLESNNNTSGQAPFYGHWEYWILAGIILLALGISLKLYYKNK